MPLFRNYILHFPQGLLIHENSSVGLVFFFCSLSLGFDFSWTKTKTPKKECLKTGKTHHLRREYNFYLACDRLRRDELRGLKRGISARLQCWVTHPIHEILTSFTPLPPSRCLAHWIKPFSFLSRETPFDFYCPKTLIKAHEKLALFD